jgi:hypothetical protein
MSKLIGQAIKEINSSAEFHAENYDVNSIEWLNGTTPIPVADIQAKITELETAKANEENQKAIDKANGNQKLLDLGLSQAEATALTGYTPPTEV